MAVTMDRQELYRLARLGAESRLRALEDERAHILRSFPGLKAGTAQSAQTGTSEPVVVRRRRQMSVAERKSVSARMKKYWAERRKANAKKD